ncbi:protocadherin-23, partial [Crotalus tigris]|uniref:protocadherin-23 n=1 Tax=Crotalus tigris TaxID=88082 RepID=UPI00192F2B51
VWETLLYLPEAGASVSEGARSGDYIARVSVSDPDEQPGKRTGEGSSRGGVELSLEGGDGAFSLPRSGDDSGVYFLCVEGSLGRESRQAYELCLTAVDAALPPLSSHRALALRVADQNEQAPASPGAVLFRLSRRPTARCATPRSGSRRAFPPRPAQRRRPEAPSRPGSRAGSAGAVVGAGPGYGRAAPLVADANDHEPVFRRQVCNVSLGEHCEVLQVTWPDFKIHVVFMDFDRTKQQTKILDILNIFFYNGFHSNEKSEVFQIDISRGCIYVCQDLDREEDPSAYDFLVKVIDEVIPLPKGFFSSSQYIRHFAIPENFRLAQIMGSLKRLHQHLYPNRKQHFIIPEEDSDIPFEIDNTIGDLFLSKALD